MKRMIITQLTLSGIGKKDAILQFKKGLNVITGDSDTGKTFAFQCIEYIFGSKQPPKNIKEAIGYNHIGLDFIIKDSSYRLERTIGSNKIDILHNGEKFTIACKHNSENTNNLSRFLLQLLQEHDNLTYLKFNKFNRKKTLSFRNLAHLAIVNETQIIQEESIFQSPNHQEKTLRKSILKYIITGEDDQNIEEFDDPKIDKIRRTGIIEFLENKKNILKNKISAIEENQDFQLYKKDKTTDLMLKKIKTLRDNISHFSHQITQNQNKIENFKKLCCKDEVKISEFENLNQHYREKLEQTIMISTYSDFLEQLPHLNCPICKQSMKSTVIDSHNCDVLFEYFRSQTAQLKFKIKDLVYSINDIKEQLNNKKILIKNLLEKNTDLSKKITENQILLSSLTNNITAIRQLDIMNKSLEIYKQELSSIEADISNYSKKSQKSNQYTNNSISPLYNDYCNEIKNILIHWGFETDINVAFDAETLDLSINGKARSQWGKGYRAFILSAMVIGLMRYCTKNNLVHPGFVILDSPLVSLKERKKNENNELIEDYMEKKMISDILEEDCLHQVIIFENKNLKYDYQYNHIQFTHASNVRKGFIPL